MLSSVLGDYLSRLDDERAFDAPLMALLAASGFYDIHFTHGIVEFGKDFIAKRNDDGSAVQYSFQSKCGNINQADWRNEIQAQMLEAVVSTLSHPNFDQDIPHQSVLVTTGRLVGNAALGMQNLNVSLIPKINARPVILWDKPILTQMLATSGPEAIHHKTASSFINIGQFYTVYGKSIDGTLTDTEIERHSRSWLPDDADDVRAKMLAAVLEAEMLAANCNANNASYERIVCALGLLRAEMHALHAKYSDELFVLFLQSLNWFRVICRTYIADYKHEIATVDGGLLNLTDGFAKIFTYPLHCSRLMEIAGLLYFLSEDPDERSELARFVSEFVVNESGISHVVADKYAVSLVPLILCLIHAGNTTAAEYVLKASTIWLCDRFEEGFGIARIEADAYEQVATLLGYAFEGVPAQKVPWILAATVIADLAAILSNAKLYQDIVNDFKAVGLAFCYWQCADTLGQYMINATDIIQYPNIEFSDELSPFDEFSYAEHIKCEPRVFALQEKCGPASYLLLSLLLRDRYFPGVWPILLQQS